MLVQLQNELEAERARSKKLLAALRNYAATDDRENGRCPAKKAIEEYEMETNQNGGENGRQKE